jgi:hypothetical protein
VTSSEAFSRIVRGHPWIIGICLALPLLLVGLTQWHRGVDYTSVSRVQVAAELAGSTTEADAASSRATAIVTSPSVVATALGTAGIKADATKFAAEHVAVTRIGVSPVVAVSVTYGSANKAQEVAQSLSTQLVDSLNSDVQTNAQEQRDLINGQIRTAQAQLDRVTSQLLASPHSTQFLARQQVLGAQLGALRTERSQLAISATQPPVAKLIDPATSPHTQTPSGLLQQLGLALLFGALLGLAVAGVVESLRPHVPSPAEAARKLAVPHVGDFGSKAKPPLVSPARRLAELARASGVASVVLLPVSPLRDSAAIIAADRLAADSVDDREQDGAAPNGHRVMVVPLDDRHRADRQSVDLGELLRWRPLDADDLAAANDPLAGFVLLVTARTRMADLRQMQDELDGSGRPLLAVLGVRGRLEPRAPGTPRATGSPTAAPSKPDAATPDVPVVSGQSNRPEPVGTVTKPPSDRHRTAVPAKQPEGRSPAGSGRD